jgi:hypothetical protein
MDIDTGYCSLNFESSLASYYSIQHTAAKDAPNKIGPLIPEGYVVNEPAGFIAGERLFDFERARGSIGFKIMI